MPQRYYDPPQLRYLKARLSMFQKPVFWRSGLFLLIICTIGWQYLSNPNFLADKKDSKLEEEALVNKYQEELSSEDKGIAADIDNVPFLLDDVQKAALSGRVIILEKNPAKKENFLNDSVKNSSDENQKYARSLINNKLESQNLSNQFIVEANNLLRFSAYENKSSEFLGINNINQSSDQLSNSSSNNRDIKLTDNSYQTYLIPKTNLITPDHPTVLNQEVTENMGYIDTINMASKNNLPNPSLMTNNNSIQPIQATTNNQPSYIYLNSPQVMPNSNVLPVNSGIPNSMGTTNVNTVGGYGNYNGYVTNPVNPSPPSNFANPGY